MLIQVLLVGAFKDITPLESHPIISNLRQPDNLDKSSFKAKHSNSIFPLSRFQDAIWDYIHISVSCIYQKPETPHRSKQKLPTKVIEISWNIRPSSLIFTLGCTPLVIYQLHSKLDSWRHIFIHSPTNSTTNNSAPKLRKKSFGSAFSNCSVNLFQI